MSDARGVVRRSKTVLAQGKCSSSCLTKDHKSWGECVRSKSLQLSPAVNDSYGSRQKAWDKELDNYEKARSDGLNPAGTKQEHIDAAYKEADNG
jgi:hypothetical protein